MAWVSLCVIALLAGQVGGARNEPTPAVRPATSDLPKTPPGTPTENPPTNPAPNSAVNPAPNPAANPPTSPADEPAATADRSSPPANADGPRNPNLVEVPPASEIPPRIGGEVPKAADPRSEKSPAANEIPDAATILGPPSLPGELPPGNPLSTPPKTSDRAKSQAQEMVAESLQIPAGSATAGQPWPLAQALAASTDRKQQLLVIHGYWQLTEALAKYHFAFEQTAQLGQLRGRPADDTAMRAARAAATATLRESELAVISAQHDFAALVQLPAESPLPLPADRPHVGGYRTNFQSLFGRSSPPPIARVIDRTLPIRLTAIKERTAAVQAAQDAFLAAADSYQAGQTDLSVVMSAAEQLLLQRRAMIETVCRYNHDIAEYAVSVLGPNVTAQQLVGALIEQGSPAVEPRPSEHPGDIQPAEYLQPITPSGQLQPVRTMPGQPTPALRPARNPPALVPVETRPPATFNHSANKNVSEPDGDPLFAPEPAARSFSPEPSARSSSPEPTATGEIIQKPDKSNPTQPNAVADQSPVDTRSGLNDSKQSLTSSLYSALIEAPAAVRAKQLTLALHWDRSLPENSAKPMSLSECLAREAGGNRRETLAVFWTTRQRAAEYQALVQNADFLENLASDALERRNEPAGAAEMLYLRAARLSAKAAVDEAQAALVESEFELALRTQSTAEKVWPLASTPPHSGSYDLNLSAQPRQLVSSRPMLRLSAAIPVLGVSVQEHADAVVEADAARSAIVESYLAGAKPLGSVLQCVSQQTRHTFAFLQTLTDYNRSVAEFALTVLPADIPADKLAAALVVQP
jgi:hypothetical protein